MICNVVGILIFLSVCGIVASSPDRAVDCRKFVFAPLCRGVAAKRGQSFENGQRDPAIFIEEKNLKDLLKSIYPEIGMAGVEDEEDNHIGKFGKQEETEKPVRKYQYGRNNHIYRLLLGNRRINSAIDNIPVHEYESL